MRFFLIAGEPSGDILGARLIEGLRSCESPIELMGVGGPEMQAAGLESLYPMDDLTVIGIAEVIPRYPQLRRRLHQTVEAIVAARPDALITIDSPDFCLRAARLARARLPGLRTIHYVAPTVWAWRPGVAAKMAHYIDHVLALFPFEPPLMEAAGMTCDFVGHPVATEPKASAADAAAFRASAGIAADAPVVLALPGSRHSEVNRLSARFGATLERVARNRPGLRVVVPTVPQVAGMVAEAIAGWPGDPVLVGPPGFDPARKRAAFASGDAALAASGTVALVLAHADVPMVIGYDVSPISRVVMRALMTTREVCLVNILTGSHSVPEFLGRDCRPETMAPALERLLAGGSERAAQHEAMARTMELLGAGGDPPGLRAARSVLSRLAPV